MAVQQRSQPAETLYAIALGSNRRHGRHGAPAAVIAAALAEMARLGRILALSKTRRTDAIGPAGRAFANAAAILASDLDPDELLGQLKRIEQEFGRRRGRKWGPRVLDLDIILWSNGAWSGPAPIIPHPEFRHRDFVLAPLADIAPHWRDPISGATVRQLLFRLRRAAVDPDPVRT